MVSVSISLFFLPRVNTYTVVVISRTFHPYKPLLYSPVLRYWENPDFKTSVSIVPTSALTGEGVPDLLYMLLKLTQDLMVDKLEVREELECTVIEVKNIEGLGTTIDVVLLNGTLREGDTIVLAGIGGPIVTTIRALLTPQPMKEMRVKRLVASWPIRI